MRISTPAFAGVTLAALLVAAPAIACSAFLVEGGADFAVAKSYDWDVDTGVVIANRRGVAKKALVLDPRQRAHAWTSKYASVTFNQYGAEMPNGGMNEAGLVVEVLWLKASRYPDADERPVLNELQWIQWALDTQGTTAQLVAAAPTVRVAPAWAKVHYFVCDGTRACATFEYIDGKLAVRSDLPFRALTNHTYDASAKYVAQKRSKMPRGTGSLERFARIAHARAQTNVGATAFEYLDNVSQGSYSVWHIAYLPGQKQIQFRTYEHGAIKTVQVDKLGLGCADTPRLLDIQRAKGGDVTVEFVPYTTAANAALLRRSLGPIADAFPPGTQRLLAAYPSTLACAR